MAVVIMINNYLHDLATAVFAVSALAAYFLLRSPASREAGAALQPVVAGLVRVGFFALVWTLAGGWCVPWPIDDTNGWKPWAEIRYRP